MSKINPFTKKTKADAIISLVCLIFICSCNDSRQVINETQKLSTTDIGALTSSVTPKPTEFPIDEVRFFISSEVPKGLRDGITLPYGVQVVTEKEQANVVLEKAPIKKGTVPFSQWQYVLATAFPRLSANPATECMTLFSTSDTMLAFSERIPQTLNCKEVEEIAEADFLSRVQAVDKSYALLPFEAVNPKWQIDDWQAFPNPALSISFSLGGDLDAIQALLSNKDFYLPLTNFDQENLISVILTGTTALTRGTGKLMDEKGSVYPSEKVGSLLSSADITHISNEISFKDDCEMKISGMKFCSKPEYLDLLKSIDADVIELTGNHVMDFGAIPFLKTLDTYREMGLKFYGGGKNLVEAGEPLKFEIKGNKIAFLGCNAVGPDFDLATESTPGSNPCDIKKMESQIKELRTEGFNPIVTFQHMEICQPEPLPPQRGDFQRAALAGAVIVSGSQAHCPQSMDFIGDTFVHYGLGNLFFDQMDKIQRMGFIDRYYFYDNQLIAVEPIGIIREDEAQPRFMTKDEFQVFIKKYLPGISSNK
jgi:hypothetical protein